MKNIASFICALIACLLPAQLYATDELGLPAKTWTVPVIYTFDQEVTWYFDMTDSGFAEGTDLYMWVWSPTEPDAGNFDKSSDFAKLQYVGDGIYKKTLIPTEYFHCSVADIENSAGFWMRLKGLGNEVQSGVFQMPWTVAELRTFKESGKAAEIFPEKFYLNEPLSLLINLENLIVNGEAGLLVGKNFGNLHLHSGLNNFQDGTIIEANMGNPALVEKTKFKSIGDNIYKIDFVPREYYEVDEDFVMENISFVLATTEWAYFANTGKGDFVFNAPGVVAPPDPVFYFFPKKFTQEDMLTLVRTNNEKNSKGLVYTITGGSKSFTGEFTGAKASMKAHINLWKELSGQSGLTKINLQVSHKDGAEIVNTDIPLVPLSELE